MFSPLDEDDGGREDEVWRPAQLIFKVVHFMIAVVMMQDQLHVATVD